MADIRHHLVQLRENALDIITNLVQSLLAPPYRIDEFKSKLKKDRSIVYGLIKVVKNRSEYDLLKGLDDVAEYYCTVIERIGDVKMYVKMNRHDACYGYVARIEKRLRLIIGYWTIEIDRIDRG